MSVCTKTSLQTLQLQQLQKTSRTNCWLSCSHLKDKVGVVNRLTPSIRVTTDQYFITIFYCSFSHDFRDSYCSSVNSSSSNSQCPGTSSKRNSSLPIPTDNQLSHPIRKYILETLLCYVLGQPSYALTCLLVFIVSQYLDVPLQFTKPITIKETFKWLLY